MTTHHGLLVGAIAAAILTASTTTGCDVADDNPHLEPVPEAHAAPPPAVDDRPREDRAAAIARGEKLVTFGGCNDCHTPWKSTPGGPMPDMTRMLSGHPEGAPDPEGTIGPNDMVLIGPTFTSFRMPFGVIYSQNLTPDPDTGLGSWTEQMFLDTFRKAKHMGGGGRPILPPMPWPNVASLPDEDLRAIFAYLQSIPPIRNAVPLLELPSEIESAIDGGNQQILRDMASHRNGGG